MDFTSKNLSSKCLSFSAASFNQPRFYSNSSWNPDATTFADKHIIGTSPHALFINTNNTVFAACRDTGDILVWLDEYATATTTIPANVSTPWSIFVTSDDQIFVDNQSPNNRVDRWALNRSQLSSPMSICSRCAGIFIDVNNNLYCSQDLRHQVVSQSLSSQVNSLTIVAGTGSAGSASNMLNSSNSIFVTTSLDLYVADCYNDRIQRFRSGKLNATTVAGNGSSNGTSISLHQPRGVVLDGDGYLFITDSGNHRIVGEDANGFRCLVGCNGSGSASNQLNSPFTMTFDVGGNMFPRL